MTCNKERQSELACKLKVTAEKSESVFLRFAAGSEDLDSMSSHFDSKKTTVKMATMPCYQSSRTGQPARSIPMVPAHNNRDRYGFICDPAYFPAISYGRTPESRCLTGTGTLTLGSVSLTGRLQLHPTSSEKYRSDRIEIAS